MALSRRRDSSMIWPGFVDAVTTLLMVLMFVLTIFTVMQSVLRETISTQGTELDSLNAQVAQLAEALGLERIRADQLQGEVGALQSSLTAAEADAAAKGEEIALLSGTLAAREADLTAAQGRIASFEAQVATLLTERDAARGQVTDLTASVAALQDAEQRLITQQEALNLALAQARTEIDEGEEAARLAAARREALEALIADLRARNDVAATDLTAARDALSDEEAARLADQAALAALQDRLRASDAELTSMTLALEEQRQKAEETLTLLAAAETDAARAAAAAATDEQRRAALLATAEAALNQQIAALRGQLGELQGLLDASATRDADAQVQLEALGSQLNAALAQVASEQRRRADLEAAERARAEAEALDLARYRSEFFGQLSQLLAGREGVRVVGDRFVFSSEVLFTPGAADLAPEGRAQIAGVVEILNDVAGNIPPGIDWIIRVDGHTDNVPLSGAGEFADNWELSQARALSVVRYMQDELGFPPDRMAAAGFGEYRPVAAGDDEAARAQNRRIELKLTER
jgi:chemotaxis protein MotB